ncbi:Fin protein [Geomicrobium sp. JCM 19037]|uniref:anti-sigma-F factor Fin n=2 Tax=unclassified Geomicrobium TaxID=2628951 RepID=UPI00045F2B84|nr:anti-sigma-F factor Fin [Geomicrobium sp. JCM 19037]GAK04871.1 Fin protein [Geomicrobium sp. JCM 19037]
MMVVYYRCRQCLKEMGKVSSEKATHYNLGFDALTEEEQAEMISADQDGHVHVELLCEHCHQMTANNPDLHAQTNWYH